MMTAAIIIDSSTANTHGRFHRSRRSGCTLGGIAVLMAGTTSAACAIDSRVAGSGANAGFPAPALASCRCISPVRRPSTPDVVR